ncbi:MAG: hypothetical protein AB7V08_03485 [Elusimicrobiales bacterium]
MRKILLPSVLFLACGCFLKTPALYQPALQNNTSRVAELLERGADLLVIGGMVELPGAVLEVNVRLVEVESGQAVGAASGRVPRDWVSL